MILTVDLEERVADLAARTGFPVPAVTPDRAAKRAGIAFDPGTGVLHVPPEAVQQYPPYLQDFLIAQEFVQTRLGVHEKTARMRTAGKIAGVVPVLAALLIMEFLFDGSWAVFAIAVVPVVIASVALNIFITHRWTHPFLRRSDRQLVTLLGPDAVRAALTWLDDHYQGGRFVTFPLPKARLAWLAAEEIHR
ncbi:hypothetical protein ACIA49_18755 [Kribbella sp. NPDC051587]|uniref:hypothetical protein n=1 Tax=Kribbella sp. NPDC051587 TaxID=3364119 RepID=UPI0037B1E6A2